MAGLAVSPFHNSHTVVAPFSTIKPQLGYVVFVAIHGDLNGVRSRLFACALLSEVFQTTQAQPVWRDQFNWQLSLRRTFARYWQAHGTEDKTARRAAWRATLQNENGVADALRAWGEFGDEVERAGERSLGELLIHPGRIIEQLLTLRMVQTLALLDILHYREQVHALGRYGSAVQEPTLQWGESSVLDDSQKSEKMFEKNEHPKYFLIMNLNSNFCLFVFFFSPHNTTRTIVLYGTNIFLFFWGGSN